jgi:guanylate kinase
MQGNLFIVAAPSGAGKSSLVNAVLAQEPDVRLSVSYTTRAPRPTEQHSREYHFVERPVFEAMMAAGDFLECAEVYGNFYGTSRRWISQTLDSGLDVVLEIDWQGARQVRALFPQTMSVYLLPPSLRILEVRLRGRGQDSDEVIARRLAAAQEDMAHLIEFDYVIINNDFQEAAGDLRAILRASRLTGERQRTRHALLIQNLLTR